MDLLKRSVAPLTDEAWQEIDAQAVETLRGNLSARYVVDFDDTGDPNFAAINLGRVDIVNKKVVEGATWGLRQVQPLLEVRVPFTLDIAAMDDISRGERAPRLDPVQEAARQAAIFEETVLYDGLEQAGIDGLATASTQEAVQLGDEPDDVLKAVDAAVLKLQHEGIGGPYTLVLGTDAFRTVRATDRNGWPLRQRVETLIEGKILWSPVLSGGVLMSARGGDYFMTVGRDLAIGYQDQDAETVTLQIVESFTFQVAEPAAAVVLK